MKKVGIIALAALLVVAFTLPTWALESEFGGYWRTRFFTNQNFTGEDETEEKDFQKVDTRTRLYYTAIFHENLKFVNKFEWDATWGTDSLGDIGADGKDIEIKNSYADFNLGPVNFKVGIQGAAIARGFIFDDDFSGAIISFNGPNFSIPFVWVKAWEGGSGRDANDFDVDYYGILPSFTVADSMTINPFILYGYSDNVSSFTHPSPSLENFEELNLWYAGLNFDMAMDPFSMWATGIYQGGDVEPIGADDAIDFSAWLAAVGFSVNFGMGDVHGEFFYATGEDAEDEDWELFWVPEGQSYYWSEIMGYGIFDDQVSRNSCADQIGNIMAGNIGVTFKPVDKLSISVDAWYAALAEDIMVGNDEENYLGTEVDLKITYELVKGLNLDIVGAYLFAGEATTLDDEDEADPYEVGTRLSLSF